MWSLRLVAVLGTTLLVGAARRDTDPEPPPAIKIANASGADVKVSSGAKGPVLTVTTTSAAKAKKAKAKKGKAVLRAASFELSFPAKEAPRRLTFRFKSHDQLTQLVVYDQASQARLVAVALTGAQTTHYTAAGAVTTDAKAADLTLTVVPGKNYLEVQLSRPPGKAALPSPLTLNWRGPPRE